MRRMFATAVTLGLLTIGLPGCAEKSSVKTETTTTSPTGTKTVTHETEIKESGKVEPGKSP